MYPCTQNRDHFSDMYNQYVQSKHLRLIWPSTLERTFSHHQLSTRNLAAQTNLIWYIWWRATIVQARAHLWHSNLTGKELSSALFDMVSKACNPLSRRFLAIRKGWPTFVQIQKRLSNQASITYSLFSTWRTSCATKRPWLEPSWAFPSLASVPTQSH